MQLTRFNFFVDELSKNCNFPASVVQHRVYRKFSGVWFDEDSNRIEKKSSEVFDRTLARQKHWRPSYSVDSYYPIKALNAVVVITSKSPPTSPTRQGIQNQLDVSLKHSKHAFDATFDGLTGLANAATIETLLYEIVGSNAPSEASHSGELMSKADSHQIATISFDIDHFKQVNDSYGHDYGDVVLMCFARRIQERVKVLEKEYSGCHFNVGRVGGEEFLLVVSGVLDVILIKKIGEVVRRTVEENVLPTDKEWDDLPADKKPKNFSLPHVAERKITSSVGISSIKTISKDADVRAFCASLRREADVALYCAKAGGRNVVRYFPSIRDNHGVVIDHHKETGIVIIDTAVDIIDAQRKQKRYEDAVTDYKRLKKCGVVSALFENQSGLCFFESASPDLSSALSAFRKAYELDGSVAVYACNLALVEYATGDPATAHELYSKVPQINPEYTIPDVYLPSRAMASYLNLRYNPDEADPGAVLEMLKQAATKPFLMNVPLTVDEVYAAIEDINEKYFSEGDKGNSGE